MSRSTPEVIQSFLAEGPYAVVGASTEREKYGNKVLRCYLQHGREVYPINPKAAEVEGLKAYASLDQLPARVKGLSVITPPAVTERVVRDAARLGIPRVWMQPGAESPEAIRLAEELGLEVIAGGPCVLVVMGFSEGH